MKKADLTKVIKDIRSCSVERGKIEKQVFPYLEMYPRVRKRMKDEKNWDLKIVLMNRVRDKFQSLTNPYKHNLTLKKSDIDTILPKLYIKERNLSEIPKVTSFHKHLTCNSVTPKKKNLLFYHLIPSPSFQE